MHISYLDTSLHSENDGDHIIARSVDREFPQFMRVPRVSTHRFMRPTDWRISRQSQIMLVTGTNILGSRVYPPSPWRLGPMEIGVLRGKVLHIGAGWRDYEGELSRPKRAVYQRILYPGIPVSTRDQYSADRLTSEGFAAVNTGCPTMWSLPEYLPALSQESEAVCTITDYRADPVRDARMLEIVGSTFDRVLVWPQGSGDEKYLRQLPLPANAEVISRGVASFERALAQRAYVGTRLHAGIRASQLGRPALVVAIDNRAREIAKDTSYPTIEGAELADSLRDALDAMRGQRRIAIRRDEIAEWKRQVLTAAGRAPE